MLSKMQFRLLPLQVLLVKRVSSLAGGRHFPDGVGTAAVCISFAGEQNPQDDGGESFLYCSECDPGLRVHCAYGNGHVGTCGGGMQAVSRILMSVSIGEEDRKSLTDVIRNMFRKYIPLVCVMDIAIIACAVPLAGLYYKDPSAPVFAMTVWGFRLLPLCMPTGLICMHFMVYGQAMGKQLFVYLLSIIDGVICVAAFTALLIPFIGMNSVYIANILNGIVTALFPFFYAAKRHGKWPRNTEELLDLPDNFGVPESDRMEMSVQNMEEVVRVADKVQGFCRERGLDERRSYMAGLCLEEIAGNVVEHGFTKDNRRHNADLRVIRKGEELILRIKDDCTAFDPAQRREAADPEDPARNIGIRMVYSVAKAINYQNLLGLNVLTIRI